MLAHTRKPLTRFNRYLAMANQFFIIFAPDKVLVNWCAAHRLLNMNSTSKASSALLIHLLHRNTRTSKKPVGMLNQIITDLSGEQCIPVIRCLHLIPFICSKNFSYSSRFSVIR